MPGSATISTFQTHVGHDFNVHVEGDVVLPQFEQVRERAVAFDELDPRRIEALWRRVTGKSPGFADVAEVMRRFRQGRLVWYDVPQGRYFATRLGIMLLAEHPVDTLPQLRIVAEVRRSDTDAVTTTDDVLQTNVPLPAAVDEALEFVLRAANAPGPGSGEPGSMFPPVAVQEALVNAVAHRDYLRDDAAIHVRVVPGKRIVVASPGGLPAGLTLKQLESGDFLPRFRNPLLAGYLKVFGLLRQQGLGIRWMRELMRKRHMAAPKFEADQDQFVVTLLAPPIDPERSERM